MNFVARLSNDLKLWEKVLHVWNPGSTMIDMIIWFMLHFGSLPFVDLQSRPNILQSDPKKKLIKRTFAVIRKLINFLYRIKHVCKLHNRLKASTINQMKQHCASNTQRSLLIFSWSNQCSSFRSREETKTDIHNPQKSRIICIYAQLYEIHMKIGINSFTKVGPWPKCWKRHKIQIKPSTNMVIIRLQNSKLWHCSSN